MDGKVCTPEELALPETMIHCLTRKQTSGLLIVGLCGLISFVSVSVVFALIVKNACRAVRGSGDRHLLKMPIELYLLSLFTADFIHGLGATLKLKWVYDGKVQSGTYCNVQGIAIQVGSTAIAMSTLVIAVHTFVIVWRGVVVRSFLFPTIIVGAIWVYNIVFTAASMRVHNDPSEPFYQPVPYWCWIGNRLPYRIVGQWVWMWLALLTSLLLYFLLFLWIRGYVTVNPEYPWWRFKMHRRRVHDEPGMQRPSYALIAYAVIYAILVLPVSIVRWIQFVLEHRGDDAHLPSGATFAAVSIYHLIGVANILLFFFTREGLLFFKDNTAQLPSITSERSSIAYVSTIELSSVGNDRLNLEAL